MTQRRAILAGFLGLSLLVSPAAGQDEAPEPEGAEAADPSPPQDEPSQPDAEAAPAADAEPAEPPVEETAEPEGEVAAADEATEDEETPAPDAASEASPDTETLAAEEAEPAQEAEPAVEQTIEVEPSPAPKPQPQVRALVGATIISGDGSEPITDGILLLGAKRITAVGARADVAIPEQAEIIDVTGRWIVPGLVDGHAHFAASGSLYSRPDFIDLRDITPYKDDFDRSKADLSMTFERFLGAGVTSVFDAGGAGWSFDARALADGAKAPRVAATGPIIATESIPAHERLVVDGDAPIVFAPTADVAAELAQSLIDKEPDAITIWALGGGAEGAERARAYTAAVKAVAEPAGISVAVHATDLGAAKAAVLGGADTLIHSVENRKIDDEFIRLLKNRNVTYVTALTYLEGLGDAWTGAPDLSPEERRVASPPVLRSLWETPLALIKPVGIEPTARQRTAKANAKRLMGAGIRVATGTDAGNVGTLHGGSMHREIELLAEAGIAPLDIITMATQNAAYALTANPDFGVLKAGYAADLLVLRRDPLVDVSALADIETVWIGGRSLERTAIVPRTAEAVVQEQLDAYNRRDLDAFTATFTDDIRIYGLSRPSSPQVGGKNQLREVYGSLFNLPDEKKIVCEVVNRISEGAFVTDQQNCRTLDGRSFRARTTVTYEVKDGRIAKMWFAE